MDRTSHNKERVPGHGNGKPEPDERQLREKARRAQMIIILVALGFALLPPLLYFFLVR